MIDSLIKYAKNLEDNSNPYSNTHTDSKLVGWKAVRHGDYACSSESG